MAVDLVRACVTMGEIDLVRDERRRVAWESGCITIDLST